MLLGAWIHPSLLAGHTLLAAHSAHCFLNCPCTNFLLSSIHYGAFRSFQTADTLLCFIYGLAGHPEAGREFLYFLTPASGHTYFLDCPQLYYVISYGLSRGNELGLTPIGKGVEIMLKKCPLTCVMVMPHACKRVLLHPVTNTSHIKTQKSKLTKITTMPSRHTSQFSDRFSVFSSNEGLTFSLSVRYGV